MTACRNHSKKSLKMIILLVWFLRWFDQTTDQYIQFNQTLPVSDSKLITIHKSGPENLYEVIGSMLFKEVVTT